MNINKIYVINSTNLYDLNAKVNKFLILTEPVIRPSDEDDPNHRQEYSFTTIDITIDKGLNGYIAVIKGHVNDPIRWNLPSELLRTTPDIDN